LHRIALTCAACKIIIVKNTLKFLKEHNIINKEQHGFLAGKSTITNLLDFLNDWTLSVVNKRSVAVACIDFAKAFDSMTHRKLCYKLRAYWVSGNLLKWIENLLMDRSQCTRVGDSVSSFISITSGVIQGSCIGALLFILYVNDVTDLFDNGCLCKLHDDDLKLYTSVSTVVDLENLQSSLSRLVEWSHTWQLKIAYTKCSLLYINGMTNPHNVDMLLGDDKIVTADLVKDLGIAVGSELKVSEHIGDIVAHAHAQANLIHKCFLSRDVQTLNTRLYCLCPPSVRVWFLCLVPTFQE